MKPLSRFVLTGLLLGLYVPVLAHHVLGRPSYNLNEDSTTPPAMQMESQLGDYNVILMAFPAFPEPNEPGRLNLYITALDDGKVFDGKVSFKVTDDSWFPGKTEHIGTQTIDDNVYRQGFVFKQSGAYVITAAFEANGEPYYVDFPLRIGQPPVIGPLGLTVGAVVLILIGANLFGRRRMLRLQISRHHQQNRG